MRTKSHGLKRIDHPEAGPLPLSYEITHFPQNPRAEPPRPHRRPRLTRGESAARHGRVMDVASDRSHFWSSRRRWSACCRPGCAITVGGDGRGECGGS
ncbi:hypothetical protein [Streptomyces acidicola]|uniref:hypothetical protein n=1 Tax=Streptomyces acidicola TaxID=2596892 RepID=UPI0018835C19